MEYILQNEKLQIKINSMGAELTEIINKNNGLSYLWDANPAHWKRSSPVLFPNVGKYFNGKYLYDGKEYYQGQHGFARDMEFELLEEKENYISFILNSNEKTKHNYPFDFSLILYYELKGNEIVVGWHVINKDNKVIWSSNYAASFKIVNIDDYYILISSIAVQNGGEYVLVMDKEGNVVKTFENVLIVIDKNNSELKVTDCKSISLTSICPSKTYSLK